MKKVLTLLVILVLCATGCSGENLVTKEMYDKVEIGMTLEQVKNILGEGEETVNSETAGIATTCYQWANDDGSNIQIIFQDGVVNTMAQAGLK